jgi:hypothetical protein
MGEASTSIGDAKCNSDGDSDGGGENHCDSFRTAKSHGPIPIGHPLIFPDAGSVNWQPLSWLNAGADSVSDVVGVVAVELVELGFGLPDGDELDASDIYSHVVPAIAQQAANDLAALILGPDE